MEEIKSIGVNELIDMVIQISMQHNQRTIQTNSLLRKIVSYEKKLKGKQLLKYKKHFDL